MRLIHIADEHWDQDKLEKCRASASFIETKCAEIQPDIIVIAGDLQNRRQYLSGSSAVLPMMEHVKSLASIAPLVIIYGNAEHDPPGSLDFLLSLKTKNPVYVASRAETIAYFDTKEVDEPSFLLNPNPGDFEHAACVLHCFPYPTKQYFLADKLGLSIDESNALIGDAIKKIMMGFGAVSMDAKCPVVLVGHCNVLGATLSSGQSLLGQDIMVSKHDLALAGADYVALGHIHKAQEVGPNMWYAGSTYHCNFGEAEMKAFNEVMIEEHGGPSVVAEHIIPSRPLSLHEMTVEDGQFVDPNAAEFDWTDAELRIRIHLTKEQSALYPDELIRSSYLGAHSYTIERIIIPEERMRSAMIVNARTLREKMEQWGMAIEKEISPEVLECADETERGCAV